ncbi:MAG: hypothetical protein MUF37_03825 [Methanoregulaceae archaeon]|nr:hypothetical protein [Methanoregulaceae archaeon]
MSSACKWRTILAQRSVRRFIPVAVTICGSSYTKVYGKLPWTRVKVDDRSAFCGENHEPLENMRPVNEEILLQRVTRRKKCECFDVIGRDFLASAP